MKNQRRRDRIEDNRGASIVMVIIAMAVVGILAAIVLSATLSNFRMKSVERKSKSNFYSAEVVLDELKAGIQMKVSDQISKSYQTILENYGDYTTPTAAYNEFDTDFIVGLKTELGVSASMVDDGGDKYYTMPLAVIWNMLDQTHDPATTVLESSLAAGAPAADGTPSGNIKVYTEVGALVIKDLNVTYTDAEGYVSMISTDLRVSTPAIDFSFGNSLDLASYSLLADQGIDINNGGTLALTGQAYSGTKTVEEGSSILEEETGTVLTNGNLDLRDATQFISKGDIELSAVSELTTGETTTLWADSVLTKSNGAIPTESNGNTVELDGRTFLYNDLKINNSGDNVTLKNEFYGYNNSTVNANESSAIVINGQRTKLNLNELNKLVLAGNTFVRLIDDENTSEGTSESQTPTDVMLGESISVKSNQLVYLVPTECEGVESNPMTYSAYNALKATTGWENAILATNLRKLGGKSIGDYQNVKITPVYNSQGEGFVYLYLNFSTMASADAYFQDYYKVAANKALYDEYMKSYIEPDQTSGTIYSSLNMDETAAIHVEGNYLVNTSAQNGITSQAATGNTSSEPLENYKNTYQSLCNVSSYAEIIDDTRLANFLNACNTETLDSSSMVEIKKYTYKGDVPVYIIKAKSGNDTAFTIIDNEASTKVVGIAGNETPVGSTDLQLSLDETMVAAEVMENTTNIPAAGTLIITGDAEVTAVGDTEFTGVMMVKGTLKVQTDFTVTQNAEAWGRATALTPITKVGDDLKTYRLTGIFKNGGELMTTAGDTSVSEKEYNMSALITYENWKKN